MTSEAQPSLRRRRHRRLHRHHLHHLHHHLHHLLLVLLFPRRSPIAMLTAAVAAWAVAVATLPAAAEARGAPRPHGGGRGSGSRQGYPVLNIAVIYAGRSSQLLDVKHVLSGGQFLDMPMDVNVAVTRTVNGTNPRDVIIQICDVLSSVRLHGVVFGDETEREALAQILDFLSSQTLIPIIGIRGGSAVVMTKKEEESIFLQFGATVQQQSRVIMRIMEEYDWHSFSVVTSHYTGYQDFIYHLHVTVESSYVGWHLDRIIPLDLLDRDSDDQIKAKLRSIQTQVVVLYCSMAEAEYLFRVAETVGLTGFGYVWIVPGLRWSESERRPPGHFPTGMVTISYDDERRGLAHRAMEGVAVVATAAFNMFVEFGFIPESKLNCNNTNAFNSTLWSTFYRCLRNITWRGRDLSFNSNGYLEKPSMTVMALNNERVWEKGDDDCIFEILREFTLLPAADEEFMEFAAHTVPSKYAFPGFRVSAHSGVEVAKDDNLVVSWDILQKAA
ncbi:glutamate receptor ionotropic, NMDA 2A-like [Lethenteron reissneri]|uniref:glutamate receptor ionotropic, NMDA 2A-like n=1 Tax=Lethenteron reissneri TaxID=7753 RepID=UPI002AB7BF67|nr:glutamate receptor ionotropic, NMDA 2A-like [Lethenteron reissneri]